MPPLCGQNPGAQSQTWELLLSNRTRLRVRWDALESPAALITDHKLALAPHKVKERPRFLKKWIVDGSNLLQGRETPELLLQIVWSPPCLLAGAKPASLSPCPGPSSLQKCSEVECVWGKTEEEVSLMTVGRGGVWMSDSSTPPKQAGGGRSIQQG